MSLSPLASAFLPHYQLTSDPSISLCNSNAMNLSLAQIFCGMPPLITHSHASPLRQPITDDTSILDLIQPKIPSKQGAERFQPLPGSSSLLLSPLRHQEQKLQAIHKNIQQFHQHLKAEQLDQKTRQFLVFQL